MEEARRHLADLEPKGAVEALLAVTAFAESRFDDGNVATLLTSACHKLRDRVALVNPKDRDAFLDVARKAFGTQRFDSQTRAQLLHVCKKMKEIVPDMFLSKGDLRALGRERARARRRQVEVGAARGAEDCFALA